MLPFVANTDKAWFDYLAVRATGGRVDEVNFWSPQSTRPMKAMTPGEPVFFRLKSPHRSIAGYGFYAHFSVMPLDEAWRLFEWRNGDPYEVAFLQRIGGYRGLDLVRADVAQRPLGCTVLRDARFLEPERWIPWSDAEGWAGNIVQGKTETDPTRAARLLALVADDASRRDVAAELAPSYVPVDEDERTRRLAEVAVREGQGTFRARLFNAYGRRCAITGERTLPVLDAAHIQPYLGPRSNHVQNGLVLTKEFHALYDRGLVAVTPEYRVRVSPAIRDRWSNGKRYYAFDGQSLAVLPSSAADRPSPLALERHLRSFVA